MKTKHLLLFLALLICPLWLQAQLINEFEPNPPGADPATANFELKGTPGESFSGWILSLENDGLEGIVDRSSEVSGTFDSNGLLNASIPDLENPSFTVVLASNEVASGTDLDVDDDGTIDDTSVFGTIFDAIGIPDSNADAADSYATQLGGTVMPFVGTEPQLFFRDGVTDAPYIVASVDGLLVFDADGNQIDGTDFDMDPTVTTFGAINPTTDSGDCMADGGTVQLVGGGTETEGCAGGDDVSMVEVEQTGSPVGETVGWVITDQATGEILGLPPGSPFDLSGAPAGVCNIYQFAHDGDVTGLEVGMNITDVEGCFDLSNPVSVTRNAAEGGEIQLVGGGTEVEGCANTTDVSAVEVEQIGEPMGEVLGWVITDQATGNILGLPPGSPFDLSGAPAGVCDIYQIAHDGNVTGLAVDMNINDVAGCFDLSNPVSVTRIAAGVGDCPEECMADGGEVQLVGGGTEIEGCANTSDVSAVEVEQIGSTVGETVGWVITDQATGNILGLPPGSPFDLSGAPAGVCDIYQYAQDGDVTGLEVGMNINDVDGCFDLSNPVSVTRNAPGVGDCPLECADGFTQLYLQSFGTPGEGYTTSVAEFTDIDVSGGFDYFIATDGSNIGSSVEFMGGDGNFFGAQDIDGEGAELPLFLNTDVIDVTGIGSLSLQVQIAEDDSSDGNEDWDSAAANNDYMHIQYRFDGGDWVNGIWVEGQSTTANFAPPAIDTDFDGFGDGTEITDTFQTFGIDIEVPSGASTFEIEIEFDLRSGDEDIAIDNLFVCGMVSDECTADGGEVQLVDGGTETEGCAGGDDVSMVEVEQIGTTVGETTGWVITDQATGNILGLPPGSPFDLSGAPAGVCDIYQYAQDGDVTGLEVGMNINDVEGCFDLSNPVSVTRNAADAGEIQLVGGGTDIEGCANTSDVSSVDVEQIGEPMGEVLGWVITDQATGNILGLPPGSPFDLSGAPAGVCDIYQIAHDGNITGLMAGGNIADLDGCFELSNPVSVTRIAAGEGDCPVDEMTCPTENIKLASQADVDAFPSMYPGCTDLPVGLVIRSQNGAITDLSPLSQLESVQGHLVIFQNGGLTSLSGLDNLTSVGGVFALNRNNNLSDISALSNLESVGSLQVYRMNSLTDLGGLSTLQTVGSDVVIRLNNNLSSCAIDALCGHIEMGGSAQILQNGSGCNSVAEVQAECDMDDTDRIFTEGGKTQKLSVYPNPTANFVTIEDVQLKGDSPSITVIDSFGQRVLVDDSWNKSGEQITIDVSALRSGIYYIQIEDDATVYVSTFTKM